MNASTRKTPNGSIRPGATPLHGGGLRERNRRIGTIVALVAILLMLLAMAYIYWFGGVNKGPMKPFHSSLVVNAPELSA